MTKAIQSASRRPPSACRWQHHPARLRVWMTSLVCLSCKTHVRCEISFATTLVPAPEERLRLVALCKTSQPPGACCYDGQPRCGGNPPLSPHARTMSVIAGASACRDLPDRRLAPAVLSWRSQSAALSMQPARWPQWQVQNSNGVSAARAGILPRREARRSASRVGSGSR